MDVISKKRDINQHKKIKEIIIYFGDIIILIIINIHKDMKKILNIKKKLYLVLL